MLANQLLAWLEKWEREIKRLSHLRLSSFQRTLEDSSCRAGDDNPPVGRELAVARDLFDHAPLVEAVRVGQAHPLAHLHLQRQHVWA